MTAGAFSFGFLVSAVLSPFVGRLMDRRGPRIVIEMGIGVMAAGFLLATLVRQPWHLYVTLGMLVGAGGNCLGYTAHALFLPNWFVRRRGLGTSDTGWICQAVSPPDRAAGAPSRHIPFMMPVLLCSGRRDPALAVRDDHTLRCSVATVPEDGPSESRDQTLAHRWRHRIPSDAWLENQIGDHAR